MADKKGEVTVFIALLMTAMVSAFLMIIRAGINHSIEFMTECSSDAGMLSTLGEYHRELYEKYGLLFIDASYKRKVSDICLLADHIEEYTQKNLAYPEGIGGLTKKDILDIGVESVSIDKKSKMTDLNGDILVRAATQYMLMNMDTALADILNDNTNIIMDKRLLEDTVKQKKQETERDFDRASNELKKKNDKASLTNPLKYINTALGSGAVDFVKPDGKQISDKCFNLNEYISHREYEEGDGFICNEKEVSTLENAAFVLYLRDKCKSAVGDYEDTPIHYELEYILSGKESDRKNLEEIIGRLVTLRSTANFIYLISDASKISQIETFAAGVSAIALLPELEPIIKNAVILSWTYTESLNDVKALLKGKRVPILKDENTWITNMFQALIYINVSGDTKDQGLNYLDYISSFLLIMDKPTRNFRFMDVMEMNIRSTKDNEFFRSDLCIKDYCATVRTSGRGGKAVMITRTYGYEK